MRRHRPLILNYSGLCSYRDARGEVCRCDLLVYRNREAAVVIATERADNPGSSITQSYEHMATGVWQKLNLPIDHTLWIEHYRADFWLDVDERIDFVHLEVEGARLVEPRWHRGSRHELELILGRPFWRAARL